MRHSTERILVSHASNLPRPDDVNRLVGSRDTAGFNKRLPGAVRQVVDRQIECGVDIANDEYVKAGGNFASYIQDRVTGWEDVPATRPPKRAGVGERDRRDFPGFYASGLWLSGSGGPIRPGFATSGQIRTEPVTQRVCTSEVKYTGHVQIEQDVANLNAAIGGEDREGFIAALGPVTLGAGLHNEYYPSEDPFSCVLGQRLPSARVRHRAEVPTCLSPSTRSAIPPGVISHATDLTCRARGDCVGQTQGDVRGRATCVRPVVEHDGGGCHEAELTTTSSEG